jgi:hypothetical protein
MLERSTSHIGKGVALVAQAAVPVCPSVYRRPTISDSRNDHSSFYATPGLQVLELRNITVWCKYHAESFFLDDELSSSIMHDLALYSINRISPSLTKLVEDKQRAYRVRLFCQFVVSSASYDTIVVSYPNR